MEPRVALASVLAAALAGIYLRDLAAADDSGQQQQPAKGDYADPMLDSDVPVEFVPPVAPAVPGAARDVVVLHCSS